MITVAYGGGLNSTAMLVGMKAKGIKPDLITFADTGGEKPETYAHLVIINNWLLSIGWPQIDIVKRVNKDGQVMTLEGLCEEKKMLPSLAYGFKNCSQKFKIQPQDKFYNNHPLTKPLFKAKQKVTKYIGYDIDEPGRVATGRRHEENDKKYNYEYPLFDWGWDREECKRQIELAGLPIPPKSACYFCPASKVGEIKALGEKHPELLERALKMEQRAELTSVKGLGRRFAWADVVNQVDFVGGFSEMELPCGCFDEAVA